VARLHSHGETQSSSAPVAIGPRIRIQKALYALLNQRLEVLKWLQIATSPFFGLQPPTSLICQFGISSFPIVRRPNRIWA
jgi:hypothetical protein